jgi:hypothetical protein
MKHLRRTSSDIGLNSVSRVHDTVRSQTFGNAVKQQVDDLVLAYISPREGLVILPQPLPKLPQ